VPVLYPKTWNVLFMELGLVYKKLGRGVLLPGVINKAPETRDGKNKKKFKSNSKDQ